MKIEQVFDLLGRTVKDKITGQEGIVSSVAFDLYGCIQAVITPKAGEKYDSHWLDVSRLQVTSRRARVMEPPEYVRKVQVNKGPAEKPLP